MKELSNNKGLRSYFIVVILSIVLSLADMQLTYIHTPDLTMEANPLVTVLGLGWNALLISNIIYLAFVMIMAYFPFVKYNRHIIECNGFTDFVSKLYYDKPNCFKYILIKNPKNKMIIFAFVGYMMSLGSILCRIYVVVVNYLAVKGGYYPCVFCAVNVSHTYCNMMNIHLNNGQHVVIPVVMAAYIIFCFLFLVCFWHYREYRINKKALLKK